MPKNCQAYVSRRVGAAFALVVSAAIVASGQSPASTVTGELRRLLVADERETFRAAVPADSATRVAFLTAEWDRVFKPRHERATALIATGRLSSPEDFFLAGMIYRYGITADDHLVAHTLLTVAALDAHLAAHDDALWQSAEALDEYLVAIDHRQIFGMVFGTPRRALVGETTDALRRRFCLPPRVELDQFAQFGVARRPGSFDRQPVTNMLFWTPSPASVSRAFRATAGVVLTPLVVGCPAPLPATQHGHDLLVSADDYFLAGAGLRRIATTADGKLMAHVLLTVAALNGDRRALAESAAALDEFLVAVGRPRLFGAARGTSALLGGTALDPLRRKFCVMAPSARASSSTPRSPRSLAGPC